MKKLILSVALAMVSLVGLAGLPTPVWAADDASSSGSSGSYKCPEGSIRSSASSPSKCNVPLDESGNEENVWPVINNMINFIVGALGVVTVVVIVMGGITFTTSQGDPQKIKKAKDMILYGIIGLLVAIFAFAIVNYVLNGVFANS